MFLKLFKIFIRKAGVVWKKQSTFILLILVLILSIYPRVWNLKNSPPPIVDEPANLRDIRKILDSGEYHLTDFHWDYSKTQLLYPPVIALIRIMGMENQLLALRLTSVILSILAIIPFYFIVRKLTNVKIAFITSLLFSFGYYYLQFSRVGWVEIIFVLTAGLYVFWFLQTAIERKSILWVILAAIITGLIFYSYRGGIVFILVTFFYLPVGLIIKKTSIKRILFFSFLFGFTFIAVALPWLIKISQNMDKYNLRYRAVSIKNISKPYHGYYKEEDILNYQIITSLKSWVLLQGLEGGGSENPRYLPGKYPPVNLLIRLGFWAGILVATLNLKKTFHFFLVLILGILLGQILTVDPPNGARGLVMLPIIYIFFSFALFKIHKATGENKLVLALFLILSILFSFLDFKFYQFWMTWIKV